MTVTTVPPGKLVCFVTGRLRSDTPEENVRQRMARSLVDEYGYDKNDLDIEISVRVGRSKKRVDIAIYEPNSNHDTQNIIGIVEAKPESVKPNHPDAGVDQLHSYLAATINSKFGLWVGSEVLAFVKRASRDRIVFEEVGDIPLAGGRDSSPLSFDALVPASAALKDVFKRCHSYISTNQGGSKEAAFHELLKVIFCKVFDERSSTTPRFFIKNDAWKSKKAQDEAYLRLDEIYTEVLDEYGYIFGGDDKIQLKRPVCAYIVKELQKYSLLDTDFDYKGSAYEEIVGTNSRGDRGEFFTPRNLCKLAVGILRILLGDDAFLKTRLIDPACGTGGFLRSFVFDAYRLLLQREAKKWKTREEAKVKAQSRLKELCDRNVFGIDFNPVLVRAAQMNLVMHGDGSSNVFHENSLNAWGEWGSGTRDKVQDGKFDAVLTNPPFGDELSVDDPHVLSGYTIHRFGRTSAPTESTPQVLFIERSWRLLKADGHLLIVTPDNIVSNPSYLATRGWLLTRFKIIATISLPGEMFQPHTGTQTTLLVLRKYAKPHGDLDGARKAIADKKVFVSAPKKIGHDQRGNLLPARDEVGELLVREQRTTRMLKKPDGSVAEEEVVRMEPVPDDQLPRVLDEFARWHSENGNS
jgi:type I restriction enzyme M protein